MSTDPDTTGPPTSSHRTISAVLADLVGTYDVIGTATGILRAAVQATEADTGAVTLRRSGQDRLHVLASTSHRPQDLQLLDAQHQRGPAFDAVQTGQMVAAGAAEIARRWPDIAPAFRSAQADHVCAVPMIWHSQAIGAVNLFAATPLTALDDLQVYADLATLAVMNSAELPPSEVSVRTRIALDERIVLEQAKGVLAQQHGIDMSSANTLLLQTAHDNRELLSVTAAAIVRQAGLR